MHAPLDIGPTTDRELAIVTISVTDAQAPLVKESRTLSDDANRTPDFTETNPPR
jgi:hypothetical protein